MQAPHLKVMRTDEPELKIETARRLQAEADRLAMELVSDVIEETEALSRSLGALVGLETLPAGLQDLFRRQQEQVDSFAKSAQSLYDRRVQR